MATNPKEAFSNVAPLNAWGPLDRTILDGGRRSPPALPSAMFGNAWHELGKLAKDKGGPIDYVALAYLAVSAALIGSKRRVFESSDGTWGEPSILWLGLVGPPSANKSPSLDPFMSILRRLESERREEHLHAILDHAALLERAKVEKKAWQESVEKAAKEGLNTPPLPDAAVEPEEPVRRRYYIQDATTEAAQAILAHNANGCLMIRDELAGWLTSFDRYNPGGRPFWIETFGGRDLTVDRKGSPKPLVIPYTGVTVIGGIQPEKLAECILHGADDGLASRFLFVWPERPPITRPTSRANLAAFEAALRRLDSLDWAMDEDGKPIPRRIPLDDAAADLLHKCRQFYAEQEAEAAGLMVSFIGKLPGLTMRLALAVEFARWAWEGGPEPQSIKASTLESVADFVEAYVMPMSARVYGDAALPPVERNAATLARYILRQKVKAVNARDLKRTARLPGLREASTIDPALEALVEANWLRPDPKRDGGGVGRKTADYLVNPAALEG